jgi:hypothetical protein
LFIAGALASSACGTVQQWQRASRASGKIDRPAAVVASARKVGDVAPDFTLSGSTSNFRLGDKLATGPALLIFYRGDW